MTPHTGRFPPFHGFFLLPIFCRSGIGLDRAGPLKQIPSGKHTSGGYSLGHINGYHHNISDFMYLYHGVSSKFLDYYLALFYWIEKNKDKSYLDQAYDIITLLSNQTKKIPLAKFRDKPISFDLKGLLG